MFCEKLIGAFNCKRGFGFVRALYSFDAVVRFILSKKESQTLLLMSPALKATW